MTTIKQLNEMDESSALSWFKQTCTATRWCQLMTDSRPYNAISMLEKMAHSHWQEMDDEDFFEAFEGHPMIGDLSSLRAKYANTKALASNEQAGTASADEQTLIALQKANHDYANKHGFIFIICATGLSAKAMLKELKQRMENPTALELANAAKEQMKITLLRIHKAIELEDTHNE